MDHVDNQILVHLQNQARISMTELGRLVGLSQPAVTERVKRMEEKGIIQEYRTIISPQKPEKMLPPISCLVLETVMFFSILFGRHPLLSSVIV